MGTVLPPVALSHIFINNLQANRKRTLLKCGERLSGKPKGSARDSDLLAVLNEAKVSMF